MRGLQGGFLGVPVGGGGRVGGGELGGQQGGAAGAEDPVSEEPADDLVQEELGGLDRPGVVGVVGGVLGAGPVVRAPVVARQRGRLAVGVPGHAALAVPAADPAPVGVEPHRGRVRVQVVSVPAGPVPGGDGLGQAPDGPVDDGRVDGGR